MSTAPLPPFYQVQAVYGAWTWTNYFNTYTEATDHLSEVADENGQAPEHATIRKITP